MWPRALASWLLLPAAAAARRCGKENFLWSAAAILRWARRATAVRATAGAATVRFIGRGCLASAFV